MNCFSHQGEECATCHACEKTLQPMPTGRKPEESSAMPATALLAVWEGTAAHHFIVAWRLQ
eukprot:6695745-Pyramimonas_sp.AAC.1